MKRAQAPCHAQTEARGSSHAWLTREGVRPVKQLLDHRGAATGGADLDAEQGVLEDDEKDGAVVERVAVEARAGEEDDGRVADDGHDGQHLQDQVPSADVLRACTATP